MMSTLTLIFLFFGHIYAELSSNELKLHKELPKRLQVLEQKLSSVEIELTKQKEINRKLESRLNAHSTLLSAFGGSEDRDLQGNVTHGHANIARVVRQEREQVAFSAYFKNSLSFLGTGRAIKYGISVLNEGNAFNSNTGIFTVPHDGVYLISCACEDYKNNRIYVDIHVSTRTSLFLEGSSSSAHNMGTKVVILRLTKGQMVWVTIDAVGQDNILQSVESAFSGVLLYF